MAAVAPIRKSKQRLNLNLTDSARQEINSLAEQSSRTITELVRLALSLLKVIIDERNAGNKLVVTTREGKPLKELVIPGF
jgi:predicted negative regulator of RcsB-dependent stress response